MYSVPATAVKESKGTYFEAMVGGIILGLACGIPAIILFGQAGTSNKPVRVTRPATPHFLCERELIDSCQTANKELSDFRFLNIDWNV